MKQPLLHLPLEPYKQRYTEFMQAWETSAFSDKFKVTTVTPDQDKIVLDVTTGEVLDSVARPLWALEQTMKVLSLPQKDLGKVYFSDFYHPGLDAIAYSRKEFQAFSFCWAQTFDRYDFTYKKFLNWMRPWELAALEIYHTVFVANELLADLITTTVPGARVRVTGLPFDSDHVAKQIDPKYEVTEKIDVVYSSRFNSEKNPHFFLDVVETMPDVKFAICTGSDEIRSEDMTVEQRIAKLTSMKKKSNLTVYKGLTKGQYYAILANSRIQFNCAYQDWVSFTLLEALTYGCYPVYPFFRSFPEVFAADPSNMYEHEKVESAVMKIREVLGKSTRYSASLDILATHDTSLTEIANIIERA